MGLLSTTHNHSHYSETFIRLPDTIKVEEHKAPTDDSIRLMEEMHQKIIQNIVAKIKVEDNLVNGECYIMNQMTNIKEWKVIFKFRINGNEFIFEKEIGREDIWGNEKELQRITSIAHHHAKGIMLWYALKMFSVQCYEKITGGKVPDFELKRL